MAKEKPNKPGKVMYQILGLRVRLTSKGEYGIYTGKHLYKAFLLFETAVKVANRIAKRQHTDYSTWNEYDQWKKRN